MDLKKDYLYYLISLDSVIKNPKLYRNLRDLIYKGDYTFNEGDVFKYLSYYDPNILSMVEFMREKKLNILGI